MLPTRYASGQSSVSKKSRLDGKPSFLPKPRRLGSIDRLSNEPRRPSTTGYRSSSAEPPRATIGGARQSREASASKLSTNRRSRSQQGEQRYGSSMTPLHGYSRTTTTPVRTPSKDYLSRSWEVSLDRALAFVTVKDQRPISNVIWQRAMFTRVQEVLTARGGEGGGEGGGGGMALIRPLTITRFVEITGALLCSLTRDGKLNNDNYITKLPHLSKRLLYPGAVSKSWLRTVNTLHAFPHALALIAYMLDLVIRIETPISDECLYVDKDDLSQYRRNYLYKCWVRFQNPDYQFEDINEEYLQNLRLVFGNDDEKIAELMESIKKHSLLLEEEAESGARADEARRGGRRDVLRAALRDTRAAAAAAAAAARAARDRARDHARLLAALDTDIERAHAENNQLRLELDSQPMSVSERARLLDEVDYTNRVHDTKKALAEQIDKMVLSKETELALWQKKTLDSCLEYNQGLIHVSAQLPDLATLAVDEKELMEAECGARVAAAADTLRACAAQLAERRGEQARKRTALTRHRTHLLEETRAAIEQIKSEIQREQQALDSELAKEASEAAAWADDERVLANKLEVFKSNQEQYARADSELQFWEEQDTAWRKKLAAMDEYIETQKMELQRNLEAARKKRAQLIIDNIKRINEKLT